MKKYKWIIILLNLVVLLVFFISSVVEKEKTLSQGKLVLLALAPVDPRSLMQGDYMSLNYAISRMNDEAEKIGRGYCVVTLDSNNVGHKSRFQKENKPLDKGELLIKYRPNSTGFGIKIGAESYFFQEGTGDKYAHAKYGGLRVDEAGNSILVGLYDEHFQLMGK